MREVEPRDVISLQNVLLFDEGVYESELQRLARDLLQNCIEEDGEKLIMEQKRAFKTVTPYPYDEVVRNGNPEFGDLRAKAKTILEEERKRYVQNRESAIKRDLLAMLAYYQRVLLKVDLDGNVSHISLIELGKNPIEYIKSGAGLVELSAIDGNFLNLQKLIPYCGQETQDLNLKLLRLRGGEFDDYK